MNLFEIARDKERIRNLPTHYTVVKKGHSHKINVDYIQRFYIGENVYILSLAELFNKQEGYAHYINNETDFQLFLHQNFYKVTEIFSMNSTSKYQYFLRKGLLHSITSHAYLKQSLIDGQIISYYYDKGKELSEEQFKHILRQKKLNRII